MPRYIVAVSDPDDIKPTLYSVDAPTDNEAFETVLRNTSALVEAVNLIGTVHDVANLCLKFLEKKADFTYPKGA